MNLAVEIPPHWDDDELSSQFRAKGLDISPLSRFSIAHGPAGFLLGFTAFEPRAIMRGVERMASVMEAQPDLIW